MSAAKRSRCRMAGPGCEGCARPVCACELSQELRVSLAAAEMTVRFVMMAYAVKDGYFSQRGLSGFPETAMQDVHDRFTERLLRDWVKADPAKNVYAFLSGMARFAGLDVSRRFKTRQRAVASLVLNSEGDG